MFYFSRLFCCLKGIITFRGMLRNVATMSTSFMGRRMNGRDNVGCRIPNLEAIPEGFYYIIIFCKDNINCDSVSNAHKCLSNNGVSVD